MGCSCSSIPSFNAKVYVSNGEKFKIPYEALVDHIILLRMVISRPELTEKGPLLRSSIRDYCERMSTESMYKKSYQATLPLDIEWIWHVHRLNPINYYQDCIKGSHCGQVVDKKVTRTSLTEYAICSNENTTNSVYGSNTTSFKPSIDLTETVLRQCDFLAKFQNHPLFLADLTVVDELAFRMKVQNYISFLKLAKKDAELVVPTYDIDIIWHTHMRYPSQYRDATTILIGYVLNHNDNIAKDVLENHFEKTAERWATEYKSKYGQDVDKDHLADQYSSSCALVVNAIRLPRPAGSDIGGCGGDGGGCGGGCGGCGGGCGGCGGCGGG